MQDIGDDMDELFKKAAQYYPLNTDSSDWNEVHKALSPVPGIPALPLEMPAKKNRSRRLLWLLLLLPFALGVYKYLLYPGHKDISRQTTALKHNASNSEQKNIARENEYHQKSPKPIRETDVVSSQKIVNSTQQSGLSKILVTGSPATETNAGKTTGTFVKNIHSNTLKKNPGNVTSLVPVNAATKITETNGAETAIVSEQDKISIQKSSAADTNKEKYDNEKINEVVNEKTEKIVSGKDEKVVNEKAGNVINENVGNVDGRTVNQPPGQLEAAKNPVVATDDLKHSRIANPIKTKSRKSHVYAGILAGPDLTSVKFQKIIKPGITGGIIAGYALNKKWSIESGFYLDKKYYYTVGEYFNTKKIPLPSNVNIVNANGSCSMIELPLNLRHNFKTNQKGNWFGIAGVSSYFMKKEVYGYRLARSGSAPWNNEYSYNNSSKNWASVINLSAGYSYNIGKTGMFRIEPYIKIPVKGVGIGSLPVTSSGVYLGFTKNLF